MARAIRDENFIPVMLGRDSADATVTLPIQIDAATGRLLVQASASVTTEFAEDAGHTSGDKGMMILAVRNDAGTALAGTDLDYIPLGTDSSGNLRVAISADVGTELPAAAALADAASATPTTPTVGVVPLLMNATTIDRARAVLNGLDSTGIGIAAAGIVGQFDDVATGAVTENQFAPVRISTRRALLVEGVASGTAIPVSIAATVTVDSELPTAAALADAASATPTTPTVGALPLLMNATTIDRARAVVNGLDSTGIGVQAAGIVGQFDDVATGAVTENQFAPVRISTRRALLVEGVASGTAIPVSGTITANAGTGTFTVDSELPAAAALADAASATPTTPIVGNVPLLMNATTIDRQRAVVNSLDSVGTGIAAAGIVAQFDETAPSAVTENQFAAVRMSTRRILYSEGHLAHDTADAGNPLKVGGRARTTQITEVAENDRVDMLFDSFAKALVTLGSSLSVATLDKTTAAAEALIAAPGAGKRIRIRGFAISSEGTEVTTARVRATIGAADTIVFHQSTDDQVGSVVMLPGFIDADTNTAVNAELSTASTNGVLFTIYYETITV